MILWLLDEFGVGNEEVTAGLALGWAFVRDMDCIVGVAGIEARMDMIKQGSIDRSLMCGNAIWLSSYDLLVTRGNEVTSVQAVMHQALPYTSFLVSHQPGKMSSKQHSCHSLKSLRIERVV